MLADDYIILIPVLSALAYFYFNWRYFVFLQRQKEMPHIRKGFVLICYMINYLFFVFCSAMEYVLIVNWSVFAMILFFETEWYTHKDRRCSLFGTLTGIIIGLAINILFRSVISIIMNQPLRDFDNHIYHEGNLKGIPIIVGFVFAGIVFQVLSMPVFIKRLKLILRYPQHHSFMLELMTGLFFYLFLNLILYSAPSNDWVLKGFSIKSCLFSMVGYCVAVWYTWRICLLSDYQEKSWDVKQKLEAWEKIEPQLRHQAFHDPLTGLYNRQQADETISSMMDQGLGFVLCFADLDGLKRMNDTYSHEEGDRYIRAVTQQLRHACRKEQDLLFRYGGDEFMVLYTGISAEEAADRMEGVNIRLGEMAAAGEFGCPVSISYGVEDSRQFAAAEEMVVAADRKMYRQKRLKQGRSGEQIR